MTDNFGRMTAVAVGSATFSSFLGVYFSFFIDASTGACIVLLQALMFLLALTFAPKHGLLAGRRVRRDASLT
jgi:ABC-type Mn2+/Zn2+ transport system permease subunit